MGNSEDAEFTMQDVKRLLIGDNGTKGLLTRLALLEQSMKTVEKLLYGLIGLVLTAFVAELINLIAIH